MKKLVGKVLLSVSLLAVGATANSSINALIKVGPNDQFRGYKPGNSQLKKRIKDAGFYATTDEVKDILSGKKKGWKVVDLRTIKEWKGGTIGYEKNGKMRPITRVGRQTPEKMLETLQESVVATDSKGKEHKVVTKPLDGVVIVCRTGTRAAFDWASYSFAGFGENVKIYGVSDWAKSCEPVHVKTNPKDCNLFKKKIELKEAKDGNFYHSKCQNIDWK